MSAASLLFLTACTNKPLEPIVDYNTFSKGMTYTFDDTLKKSVIKGPVFTQEDLGMKYSLFVDDGVIKMDYVHSYISSENKNFYKMIDYRGNNYKIHNLKNEVTGCSGQSSFKNAGKCVVNESGIVQLDPKIKYKYQLVSANGQNLDFEINVDYMDAITDFHKKHTSSSKKIRKSAHFNHKKLDDLRYGGKDNPAVRVENKRTKGVIEDPIVREEKMQKVRDHKDRKAAQKHKIENRNKVQSQEVKIVEAGINEKAQSNQLFESTTIEETKKVTVLRKIQDTKSETDAGIKVLKAKDVKKD